MARNLSRAGKSPSLFAVGPPINRRILHDFAAWCSGGASLLGQFRAHGSRNFESKERVACLCSRSHGLQKMFAT